MLALALTLGLGAIRVLTALAGPTPAQSDGPAFVTFRSSVHQDAGLRYIKDSGVCETTPGVSQVSGYLDLGTNMSMWFWFFESRHAPESAPFTLWLNGGPGCSSMIGLFQENGPCHVNPDEASTVLNPYSWNNVSNMIYIDQPIGTGFSVGVDLTNSTQSAAPWVWLAFQLLFESREFAKYQSREFIFATESYGGHYGPSFVTYFDQQNALIDSGKLKGEKVTTSALMINNGWYDPLLQNQAYVDFATNAPGYGQLVSNETVQQLNAAFFGTGGCQQQELACYAVGRSTNATSDSICKKADNFCIENVFAPAVGDRDSDDLRQPSSAPFPPEFYVTYLQRADIQKRIGALQNYSECAGGRGFSTTGDDARTWLPELSALANSRLKMLIWAGDADINCNWLGGHASVLAMDWYGNATLHATPFTNMTLNGTPVAAIQNVDHFSFARVYASGHEVPAFQPAAALAIFKQVINKEQLHSV